MVGFSRLEVSDLPLRPLNVLIGANRDGKSSVPEVVDFLAASAAGGMQA